jgi:LL-diaminopimelate aminotransferase
MIISPTQRVASVATYYFSSKLEEIRQRRQNGAQILNMGIGSPDLPPHPLVIEALQHETGHPDQHAYQNYRGIPSLRNAWADWYHRQFGVQFQAQTEVLPLMGSKEGIMHLSMAFLEPGDIALVPDPGYPTYSAASRLAGAEVVSYTLHPDLNWQPNWEELEANLDWERVKVCWLNAPHMPTGTPVSTSTWQRWIELAKRYHFLLVHDNPYGLILTETPQSILAQPGAREVAVELNSLSKSHNLAGWRMGVLVGNEAYLNEAARFKSNMDSGMFKPIQLAAVKALQLDPSWTLELNKVYRKRRLWAEAWLTQLGLSVQPNQVGMFVWAKVPPGFADGYAFSDFLLDEAEIFLAPGGIFGAQGNSYVRLSLCQPVELIKEGIRRTQNLKPCKIGSSPS